MSNQIPTVRVNHPSDKFRFMTINESDFDPKIHTLWGAPAVPDLTGKPNPSAEIPADWRELKWFALRSLAANISADAPANKAQAVAIIEAELARRA